MPNPFEIEVLPEEFEDFPVVRCRGSYSRENILELQRVGWDTASKDPRGRVLIDVREVQGVTPVNDRYPHGIYIAKLQAEFPAARRVAVLGAPPLIDGRRMVDTVARNRGANIRTFLELDEAVAWLKAD